MPALIIMPTTQCARSTPRRTRSTITTNPSSCCTSDDEDAITPCSSPPPEPQSPIDEHQHQQPHQHAAPSPTASAANPPALLASPRKNSSQSAQQQDCWHFDPTDGVDMDDERLWRRMLAIQRIFHCYNSARMSAALLELEKGEDVGRFVPSRSCLDLLNESIDLSGDARKELSGWLHDNCPKRKRNSLSWRSFHANHAAF